VGSNYTRSGVRRAGDDYQDIIALALLVEWLEHPDRYTWARVEADDSGFLDDIVALRADDVIVAKQVKFSAHPDDAADPYTWDDLLKQRTSAKGKALPSLLTKWGTSFKDLRNAHGKVEASLVSNRKPADDLRSSFAAPGVVDLERISDPSVRAAILAQLGSEQEARNFFAGFRFDLDQPGLDTLEAAVERRFLNLHGNVRGWKSLKDALRKWVRERNSPPPDGRITLEAIKSAAEWQRLEAIPEEFAVPPDFVIPDDQFHAKFVRALKRTKSGSLVLTGPPGIGKSTYISNLYRELKSTAFHVIRHHYFLSRDDRTPFRYDHLNVARSLMSEIQAIYADLGIAQPSGNPRAEDLPLWLSDCGRQLSQRGTRLVVILDGLDHVWSEAGSVDELNRLFQLVTPVPPGVVLLIGTQPVDSSQLPRRLSEVAPREKWVDLPPLEYPAVRRWAEIHATELRAIHNDEPDSHRLDEIAGALWRRSEGYPLHLRYLLKSLDTVKGYITARDIDRLPQLPHRDIRLYYARFWEDLSDESKQVLALLATCDFPWSRQAIADCLDPNRLNLAIDGAIRRVTHLTSEGPLGLQLAHSSLEFFIRQHADYQNYGTRVRAAALGWLRTQAPDVLRWSYEWLLAADSGDDEPLLRGPNRGWLIEGMARRYPVDIADRILTRSAWIALQRGELDRFVELGLLSDYLSEAAGSRNYVVEPLLAAQLTIHDDPTLPDRLLSELKSLGNRELVCVAEFYQRAGMTAEVGDCFHRLNARLRMGHSGGQDVYPRLDVGRCLARIAAFAPEVDPRNMLNWLRRQSQTKTSTALWREYTDSLRAHKRAERLRAVVDGTEDLPAERARAISQLVLLACEDGIDLGVESQNVDDAATDPFQVILETLRSKSLRRDLSVRAPEPWVLRLKEYEFYQYYDEMADFLWRMFFVFTANSLCGRQSENARLAAPFVDKGWISQFIECSVSAANKFVGHFKSGEFVSYSWIFAEFAEVSRPDFLADRTGHGFAVAARKAIFRIALDLQAVQGATHSPRIEAADVEIVRRMPIFVLSIWLEITTAYGRAWFTADGLANALGLVESHLDSTIDDFGSRAELCELAAELAALHKDNGITSKWVRRCWSNLVAYGYHKDMLLDQCLDAAEHLEAAGASDEALNLLRRLAPVVVAVGDYTDGDETRQFPVAFGRILFKCDFQWFLRYHGWLSASGEYWDARSIFETFVSKADLSNRVFRGVAETAIEQVNILALAKRSHDGDANATQCLNTMSFYEIPAVRPKDRTSAKQQMGLVETGPMPEPANFPPEMFKAYVEAVNTAGSYRVDEHVDEWGRFWAAHGNSEAVLNALEGHDGDRPLSSADPKLRFELTLKVRGKDTAYKTLVTAQANRYGWNRYFTRSEDVQFLWAKLKEIYPEKWMAFLQSTLMSDPGNINRSGVTVQGYISRLVEFLLFIEQPSLAKAVARAATEGVLQLVPLNLPAATWIPGGGS
jgi:DNA polymerase III delta prime subunit